MVSRKVKIARIRLRSGKGCAAGYLSAKGCFWFPPFRRLGLAVAQVSMVDPPAAGFAAGGLVQGHERFVSGWSTFEKSWQVLACVGKTGVHVWGKNRLRHCATPCRDRHSCHCALQAGKEPHATTKPPDPSLVRVKVPEPEPNLGLNICTFDLHGTMSMAVSSCLCSRVQACIHWN
jgi:hypothetical protein